MTLLDHSLSRSASSPSASPPLSDFLKVETNHETFVHNYISHSVPGKERQTNLSIMTV